MDGDAEIATSSYGTFTPSDDELYETLEILPASFYYLITAIDEMYENNDGIVNTPDGRNFIYSGLDVNNYIAFNDETWRVIGSVDNNIKIVRNQPITSKVWDSSSPYSNNWVGSEVNTYLNGSYLSSIKSPYKNMILSSEYKLGNHKNNEDSTESSYTNERDTSNVHSGNATTWSGSISLMYPSDYGFSADSSYWSNTTLYSYDKDNIKNTSWLQNANHSSDEWLLSPSSSSTSDVAIWSSNGNVQGASADGSYAIRPALNLKQDVIITGGIGTEGSPYQLTCNSCTESSPSNGEGPTIFDDNVGNNSNTNTKNIATTGTCNNLVYNGETQTLVSGGSNTSYENNNQIDAGRYQVIAKANTGYTFSDGTKTKILTCDISKKIVPVNFNTNTLKYNGTLQSPIATATGVKGEAIELETTKEKELGEYTTIATMKDVNPNYSLSNTVLDYKITNTNESNKITNITKVKINYYLKNKDIDSYSLVKSVEQDAKEGETVTGELINFTNYKTPKAISIKIIKGVNVIDYYYERI